MLKNITVNFSTGVTVDNAMPIQGKYHNEFNFILTLNYRFHRVRNIR